VAGEAGRGGDGGRGRVARGVHVGGHRAFVEHPAGGLGDHSAGAKAAGLSDADIALARQGTSADPREAALIGVAVRVLAEPSSITDQDVADLRAPGWSDRIIAELPAWSPSTC
ncbi:hypothetical protein JYK22_11120, partial [Nonomuraea sp. RK-328]|nr:hypothetical protein [Nonomuraea sp. RK-328]